MLDVVWFAVRSTFSHFTQEWCNGVYRNWVARHRKCIAHGGKYFEKLWDAAVSDVHCSVVNTTSKCSVIRLLYVEM